LSLDHFKQQAKNLQRLLPTYCANGNFPLAICQEIIARTHGYPSWHAAQARAGTSNAVDAPATAIKGRSPPRAGAVYDWDVSVRHDLVYLDAVLKGAYAYASWLRSTDGEDVMVKLADVISKGLDFFLFLGEPPQWVLRELVAVGVDCRVLSATFVLPPHLSLRRLGNQEHTNRQAKSEARTCPAVPGSS